MNIYISRSIKRLTTIIGISFWVSALFSQAVQTPGSLFKSGYAAYLEGNTELAISFYNQAIALGPDRSYLYYNRGIAYASMNKSNEAAADFRKSLQLKVTAEAYYQLGVLAFKHGDMAGAKDGFENALQIKEDFDDPNYYLGLISFKAKDYNESFQRFLQYTNHIKTNGEAWYFLASCQAELDKGAEAMNSLKLAALYSNGKNWKYYLKLYEVYKLIKDDQDALNNISMVIELGEHKPQYYAWRADLYKATEQDYLAEQDIAMAKSLQDATANEGGAK